MNKLVSIIIPIYNSEKYLRKCLDNVIGQTYENIEVLLLDDGSTDNSSTICKEYTSKDERFKYFYKTNSGPSKTRNLGIKKSKGYYLTFVDSDDSISKMMIENLVKGYSLKENVELSTFNVVNRKKHLDIELDKNELITNIFDSSLVGGFIWNKLFLTSILKDNNIFFVDNIYVCEDLIFCLEYSKFIKKCIFLNENCYFHNEDNKDSLSNNFNDKWFTILDAYNYIDNNIANTFSEFNKIVFYYNYINLIGTSKILIMKYKIKNININKYNRVVKLHYKEILKSNISFKNKIKLFLYSKFYLILYIFK